MASAMTQSDLLNPSETYKENYIHQLQQTIEAYSPVMIATGEAIQNAIDAVCKEPRPETGNIQLAIDFDNETVTVIDNGRGFPRDTKLLFLGGTDKTGKRMKGKIGVGIKVTIFSTEFFSIRSNGDSGAWKLEIVDAYRFDTLGSLIIPSPIPDDPTPLLSNGTEIVYRFPKKAGGLSALDFFIKEVIDTALPNGVDKGFGRAINNPAPEFPSAFCALLSSYFRRFSYIGDVLATLGSPINYPAKGINIEVKLNCTDPITRFGSELGALYGDKVAQEFRVEPSYMQVQDSIKWVPKGRPSPQLFNEKLGPGGSNLERTLGFNQLVFNKPEEYELFLLNKSEALPPTIELYRKSLFPNINGILLTIGRIPDFEEYLPGGSRRVMSCNGVITGHDIDLTRGRNQEYVRCFDLAVDLKAELNYGKTQITNMHLVKLTRDFINESYTRVMQPGIGAWVGIIPGDDDDDDSEVFVKREELGLDNLVTRKVPRDENDVIGLFFEITGNGSLQGYRVYGLSQRDTYDCRGLILREGDTAFIDPIDDTKLRIIEFKVRAADVIRDFDRAQKFANQIDLVIAWDEGQNNSKNYVIYDIEYSKAYKASPSRVYPGVTKFIQGTKDGVQIQVLLLKDIIQQIKSASVSPSIP